MELDGQRHDPADYPPEREPVRIVQKAGWASGPVLKSAENLASTGFRSPDRPVCSQPLCRMRYPKSA